jgi:hypothetical protein
MSDATEKRRRGRPHGPRPNVSPRKAPSKLSDPELIVRAMDAVREEYSDDPDGPLTDRKFAESVLLCHPRTLRKYLDGRPLPALAREKLLKIVQPEKTA